MRQYMYLYIIYTYIHRERERETERGREGMCVCVCVGARLCSQIWYDHNLSGWENVASSHNPPVQSMT